MLCLNVLATDTKMELAWVKSGSKNQRQKLTYQQSQNCLRSCGQTNDFALALATGAACDLAQRREPVFPRCRPQASAGATAHDEGNDRLRQRLLARDRVWFGGLPASRLDGRFLAAPVDRVRPLIPYSVGDLSDG